ncbi:hypothetical protein OH77DRAFT_1523666 [Trametes cingulata]|nr:hypothetical protein OH77DRAFT_1523666 [Trametes cingulata]
MADAFSTTDVVLAVVRILFGIVQVTLWIINRSLPSRKLRVLEETLQETESLLRTCVEEGRFVESHVAVELGGHLRGLRERANDLRVVTSGAKTYFDDIKNMIKGFSRQSNDLCEEVKDVRAKISSSSSGRNANTAAMQGHTCIARDAIDATEAIPQPTRPMVQCSCQLPIAGEVPSATAHSPPYTSSQPGGLPTSLPAPDPSGPVNPYFFTRLLSFLFLSSIPAYPPDSTSLAALADWHREQPVLPLGHADGRASDTQTQALLRKSSWQSVSSDQTTAAQSARRKKHLNVIGRARARVQLLRRAYI